MENEKKEEIEETKKGYSIRNLFWNIIQIGLIILLIFLLKKTIQDFGHTTKKAGEAFNVTKMYYDGEISEKEYCKAHGYYEGSTKSKLFVELNCLKFLK